MLKNILLTFFKRKNVKPYHWYVHIIPRSEFKKQCQINRNILTGFNYGDCLEGAQKKDKKSDWCKLTFKTTMVAYEDATVNGILWKKSLNYN